MKTTLKSSLIAAIFTFTFYCYATYGNEEKKIKVEDTIPPVISNVKVFDITDTSVQISWETDESAKGQIVWDIKDKITKDSKGIAHEEFTTTHSFKITNLLPSTVYYYWTASVDAKGNWKVSEPATLTTLAK